MLFKRWNYFFSNFVHERKDNTHIIFTNTVSRPRSCLVKPVPKTEESPGTNANKSKISSGQNRELDLSLEKSPNL